MLDQQAVADVVSRRMADLEEVDGLRRTRDWLARRIGRSPALVTRWFNGQRTMDDQDAREIAVALGMAAEALLIRPREEATAA